MYVPIVKQLISFEIAAAFYLPVAGKGFKGFFFLFRISPQAT
jgi:hypothetical protein